MAQTKIFVGTPLSRINISVRAMNVCLQLGCATVGELAQIFQSKGVEYLGKRRNCGVKTLAELSAIVDSLSLIAEDPNFSLALESDSGSGSNDASPNNELVQFSVAELLDAMERMQIPLGLPIELIRVPIRIHTWCRSRDWNTLGDLLNNAGFMSLKDILEVENIGKKSALEVVGLFSAINSRYPDELRKFLPLAPHATVIALPSALEDLVASLDARDAQMLEMRLIEGKVLDAVARNFSCSRELVRQVEDRFLTNVERVLNWFSSERIKLWHAWETTEFLAPNITETGVTHGAILVAAAIASVFEKTPEGEMLQEHWQNLFRKWGRELVDSDEIFNAGVSISDFMLRKGCPDLAFRFQSWLNQGFGDCISVLDDRIKLLSRKLTASQKTLIYDGEILSMRWRWQYERLKQYAAEHGNADIPHRWKEDPQLASWVSNQRDRKKRGLLSESEFGLLDELGLTWQSREVGTWEDRLAEVAAFKEKNGHCEMPVNLPENPKLGRFVNSMRTQRNSGKLSADRIAKLDALGFAWESSRFAEVGEEGVNALWKARFDDLSRYKSKHGNCKVRYGYAESPQLGRWVSQQRQAKKLGTLHKNREELLNKIGFDWGIKRNFGDVNPIDLWPVRYDQLVDYKNQSGHCNVPVNCPNNPQLGGWVSRQRQLRKKGKLTTDRERLLAGIGFLWGDTHKTSGVKPQDLWNLRYSELVQFSMHHGHCNVPYNYSENLQLASWVKNQRNLRKRGKMPSEREALLNNVGFTWKEASSGHITPSWEKLFNQLVCYNSDHGNCDVPVKWKENPQLGMWVAAQRSLRKTGKLHSEREDKLTAIGFDWRSNHNNEEWETRLEQLKIYKQRHGDCCVPVKWIENPQLGVWASAQRHLLKTDRLPEERKRLLLEIGLVLNVATLASA